MQASHLLWTKHRVPLQHCNVSSGYVHIDCCNQWWCKPGYGFHWKHQQQQRRSFFLAMISTLSDKLWVRIWRKWVTDFLSLRVWPTREHWIHVNLFSQEIMRTDTEHVTKSRRGRCKKSNVISIAHSSNKTKTAFFWINRTPPWRTPLRCPLHLCGSHG